MHAELAPLYLEPSRLKHLIVQCATVKMDKETSGADALQGQDFSNEFFPEREFLVRDQLVGASPELLAFHTYQRLIFGFAPTFLTKLGDLRLQRVLQALLRGPPVLCRNRIRPVL